MTVLLRSYPHKLTSLILDSFVKSRKPLFLSFRLLPLVGNKLQLVEDFDLSENPVYSKIYEGPGLRSLPWTPIRGSPE
jgi:hypothetical protein